MYCFAYFSTVDETGLATENSRLVKWVPAFVNTFTWSGMTDEVDLVSDTHGMIIDPSVADTDDGTTVDDSIADGNNAGNTLTASWYMPRMCLTDAGEVTTGCTYTEYGDDTDTAIPYPLFRLSAEDLVESWMINGADGTTMTTCLSTDNAAGIALTGALSLATTTSVVFAGLLTLY
jgi:hypothetical protein